MALPELDLESLYKLIVDTPSGMQSAQEIPPDFPLFHFPDPLGLQAPPQIPASLDETSLCAVCSVLASLPPPVPPSQATAQPPPHWHKIPQNPYDRGRKQWNFTPSEDISFGVNGRPGMNMGDALRERFAGLDGQDELVLQGASNVISCRLSVRSSL